MKFRPLYDRILVERVGDEEKTKSGIIIPDAAREKQQKGKIIATGKGRVNEKGEILRQFPFRLRCRRRRPLRN